MNTSCSKSRLVPRCSAAVVAAPVVAAAPVLAAALLVATALLGHPLQACAQSSTDADAKPVYTPPLRGAPKTRVSGGVRGTGDAQTLLAIAPDHTGLTTDAQPTLYWFTTQPVSEPVSLAVVNTETLATVIETGLPSPPAGGIHSVSFRELDVSLEPGIEYEWFVTIQMDEQPSSRDIVAGATIERREAPAELRAAVAEAQGDVRYAVYARGGYWYDSISTISALVERAPGAGEFRSSRAALLVEVGLGVVAEFGQ